MLLHQNHKFIYENRAAIQLPENVYLDPNPDPCPIEGLVLYSEDLRTQIEYNFLETEQDAWTYLKEIKDDFESFECLEPIRAVCINGLAGFVLGYALSKEILEEYVLSVPGETPTLLTVCFAQKKGELTEAELYSKTRDAVIAGISRI